MTEEIKTKQTAEETTSAVESGQQAMTEILREVYPEAPSGPKGSG